MINGRSSGSALIHTSFRSFITAVVWLLTLGRICLAFCPIHIILVLCSLSGVCIALTSHQRTAPLAPLFDRPRSNASLPMPPTA
ncbi:hypothetical protein GGR56DRAFT_625701 [Xylariaceae sp. FL0804]|nr:hypothetical protein GGR56DRAFT_625701 [Xylariaceae sp. FL0804]